MHYLVPIYLELCFSECCSVRLFSSTLVDMAVIHITSLLVNSRASWGCSFYTQSSVSNEHVHLFKTFFFSVLKLSNTK